MTLIEMVAEFHAKNFAPITPGGRPLTKVEQARERIALATMYKNLGRFPTEYEFRAQHPELVFGMKD